MSINKVILVCVVTAEPEIRRTKDDKQIGNLRVVTNEVWKNKSGEKQERAEFHNVVSFNEGLTSLIQQHIHKGMKLYIEGQLATRKWTDKTGNDRWTTEIILHPYKGVIDIQTWPDNAKSAEPQTQQKPQDPYAPDLDEDSPPF